MNNRIFSVVALGLSMVSTGARADGACPSLAGEYECQGNYHLYGGKGPVQRLVMEQSEADGVTTYLPGDLEENERYKDPADQGYLDSLKKDRVRVADGQLHVLANFSDGEDVFYLDVTTTCSDGVVSSKSLQKTKSTSGFFPMDLEAIITEAWKLDAATGVLEITSTHEILKGPQGPMAPETEVYRCTKK